LPEKRNPAERRDFLGDTNLKQPDDLWQHQRSNNTLTKLNANDGNQFLDRAGTLL